MIQTEHFEKVEVNSSAELRSRLHNHHTQTASVRLVTYKKLIPDKYVSTAEILDELSCFGWIDGIKRKQDDDRTMQLISPRKTQHRAKTYKDRAAMLIQQWRMQQPWLRCIELSKHSGLRDFMDDVDQLIVPVDLQEELAKHDHASMFFDTINDSSKRFVLRWIKLAKTHKTRISRIQHIAQLSAKKEKLKWS